MLFSSTCLGTRKTPTTEKAIRLFPTRTRKLLGCECGQYLESIIRRPVPSTCHVVVLAIERIDRICRKHVFKTASPCTVGHGALSERQPGSFDTDHNRATSQEGHRWHRFHTIHHRSDPRTRVKRYSRRRSNDGTKAVNLHVICIVNRYNNARNYDYR